MVQEFLAPSPIFSVFSVLRICVAESKALTQRTQRNEEGTENFGRQLKSRLRDVLVK